jgi:hypothetical protein
MWKHFEVKTDLSFYKKKPETHILFFGLTKGMDLWDGGGVQMDTRRCVPFSLSCKFIFIWKGNILGPYQEGVLSSSLINKLINNYSLF